MKNLNRKQTLKIIKMTYEMLEEASPDLADGALMALTVQESSRVLKKQIDDGDVGEALTMETK